MRVTLFIFFLVILFQNKASYREEEYESRFFPDMSGQNVLSLFIALSLSNVSSSDIPFSSTSSTWSDSVGPRNGMRTNLLFYHALFSLRQREAEIIHLETQIYARDKDIEMLKEWNKNLEEKYKKLREKYKTSFSYKLGKWFNILCGIKDFKDIWKGFYKDLKERYIFQKDFALLNIDQKEKICFYLSGAAVRSIPKEGYLRGKSDENEIVRELSQLCSEENKKDKSRLQASLREFNKKYGSRDNFCKDPAEDCITLKDVYAKWCVDDIADTAGTAESIRRQRRAGNLTSEEKKNFEDFFMRCCSLLFSPYCDEELLRDLRKECPFVPLKIWWGNLSLVQKFKGCMNCLQKHRYTYLKGLGRGSIKIAFWVGVGIFAKKFLRNIKGKI